MVLSQLQPERPMTLAFSSDTLAPGFSIEGVPPTNDGFRTIDAIEMAAGAGNAHPISRLMWQPISQRPQQQQQQKKKEQEKEKEKEREKQDTDNLQVQEGSRDEGKEEEEEVKEEEPRNENSAIFKKFAAYLKDPENHYRLVREQATGKAVAYVWWQYCPGKSAEEWATVYADRYVSSIPPPFILPNHPLYAMFPLLTSFPHHGNRFRPPEINAPLADATGGRRLQLRGKILSPTGNPRPFLMLKELFVRPSHQRRGLGGCLVELGCRMADEMGVVAYTEATPEGQGLYLRHGFEEVERVRVELEKFGGRSGEVDEYGLLLRPAQGLCAVEAQRH